MRKPRDREAPSSERPRRFPEFITHRVKNSPFFPAPLPPLHSLLFTLPLLLSLTLLPSPAHASSSATSPAFVFDSRYAPSGLTPADWSTIEVHTLSTLFTVRTRPIAPDTDGDGLPDAWETAHGTSPTTPDAHLDPDSDGRTNLQEYNAGTDPLAPDDWTLSAAPSPAFLADTSIPRPTIPETTLLEVSSLSPLFRLATVILAPDTDGDGLPDAWEAAQGTNPATPDAHLDPDSDGRTNLQEYNAGTDPLSPDDWTLSSAPSPAFLTDTRVRYPGGQPGISNWFAVYRASGTFVCDTGGLYYDWDGDGIPNWWCQRYTGSKTGIDPAADLDGDGYTALQEYTAYTDPTDPGSYLAISLEPLSSPSPATRSTLTGYAVTWPSAPGRTYTLQAITNLMQSGSSTAIATLEGTGGILAVPVPDTPAIPLRFFRLIVTLSPMPQSP